MVLAMYRVHSSMCMQDSIAAQSLFIESRCCVIVELYLEVEDTEIESTGRWIGLSESSLQRECYRTL